MSPPPTTYIREPKNPLVKHPDSDLVRFLHKIDTPLSNASIWISCAMNGICPLHCDCLFKDDLVAAITPRWQDDDHWGKSHITLIDTEDYERYHALKNMTSVINHIKEQNGEFQINQCCEFKKGFFIYDMHNHYEKVPKSSEFTTEMSGFLRILDAVLRLLPSKTGTSRKRIGEYLVKLMKEYDITQKLLSIALCRSYNKIGELTWCYYNSLKKEDRPLWMQKF